MTQRLLFKFATLVASIASLAAHSNDLSAQIKVSQSESVYGPQIEVIEMTVSPAAQPDPIFTHRLTWLPHQTTPGNAATVYMNSLGEGALRSPSKATFEMFGDQVYDWQGYATPQEEIPLDKLRKASALFDDYIEQHIGRATKRRDCDWGFGEEDLVGDLVFTLRLNSVQAMREISRALALQTKLAIMESRFDDAVDLMRMNYRLCENVGQMKILVSNLVGIAIAGITNGNMLDFIAAQDSPNMYWALTELPRPLVDVRGALRLECHSLLRIYPELKTAETAVHTPTEWTRKVSDMVDRSLAIMPMAGQSLAPAEPLQKLLPTALGVFTYPSAKKRLIESGMDTETVEAMPVGQVLLVDTKREYLRFAEIAETAAYFPLHDAIRTATAFEDKLREFENVPYTSFGGVVASMFLPAVEQVWQAETRVYRDIDALRLIEALRMHAAATGTFPKSLDEIKIVPVPNNPATGKPFQYQLDGETATIELPRSDGVIYSKRYRITLR